MGKKLFITLAILITISTVVYAILGGFKSADQTINNKPLIYIYGKEIKSTLGSDSLKNAFMKARDLVEKESEASAIAIVYYGEANEETGEVFNFIGTLLKESNTTLKIEDWAVRKLEAPNSVKACIEANVLVMPTPDDMLSNLKEYSYENKIEHDSIFIEYYSGPNNLCVELLSK